MLDQRLEQMLNEQIAHEITNSKKYRVICAWLRKEGLEGLASYFDAWSKEEDDHARWIQGYLMNRNACVDIPVTEEVVMGFKSLFDIAKYVLAVEVDTTKRLYAIMEEASVRNCYMSMDFLLNKMIHKQTEEEDKAQTLLDLVAKAKDNMAAILAIDDKYGDYNE